MIALGGFLSECDNTVLDHIDSEAELALCERSHHPKIPAGKKKQKIMNTNMEECAVYLIVCV
jgi:hypothetical protein